MKLNAKNRYEAGVVIPTLNPSEGLIELVESLLLLSNNDKKIESLAILVVNDGSNLKKCEPIFDILRKKENVYIIENGKNLGKGASLKVGIDFFQNQVNFLVTADSDGQHSARDVLKVLKNSMREERVTLGVRDFFGTQVPIKSKIGNILTTSIIFLITAQKLVDTQTGLRSFPSKFFDKCLSVEGHRYEYEINVLLSFIKREKIAHVPIETIYFKKNKASKFRPVIDSLIIYSSILKFFGNILAFSIIEISLIFIGTEIWKYEKSFVIVKLLMLSFYLLARDKGNINIKYKHSAAFLYIIGLIIIVFTGNEIFNSLQFSGSFNFFLNFFLVSIPMIVSNSFLRFFLFYR